MPRAEIHYAVSLAHPEQHLFHVYRGNPRCEGELNLQMAAWNALYEIRDFSSHVQQVEAFADGKRVAIEKLDKLTWHVKATGTITVHYDTFWDDSGPFNTQLNAEHAFINPAMILLYVPDRRAEKSIIIASAMCPLEWNVASSHNNFYDRIGRRPTCSRCRLPATTRSPMRPIEASKFEEFTLHDLSPPVHVVIHGDNCKKHDVENALRKICIYELKLMDGAPYDHYTFIFHIGKAAAAAAAAWSTPIPPPSTSPPATYLPNVSAHEFFHLWNVKRIRPASLEPVDYTHEMYTRAFWFAEGVTNTYASYTLVRTGIWNKTGVLPGPQPPNQRTRNAPRRALAKRRTIQPGCLAGEIRALQPAPAQRLVLHKGPGPRRASGHPDSRPHRQSEQPRRRSPRHERGFCQGQGSSIATVWTSDSPRKKSPAAPLDGFLRQIRQRRRVLCPTPKLLSRAGLESAAAGNRPRHAGFHRGARTRTAPGPSRSVDADGHAAKSGLLVGDEILRWNNGDAPRRSDAGSAQQKPGEDLHLRIRRDDKEEHRHSPRRAARKVLTRLRKAPTPAIARGAFARASCTAATDPVTASESAELSA